MTELATAAPAHRRKIALRGPEVPLLAVSLVVAGLLTLPPLVYLGWLTVTDLGAFERAYSTAGLGELLWNTLRFAAASTVLAVGLGTSLAYLVVRTDVPGRRLLAVGVLAPMLVPGILYTISWVFLASPHSGALNQVLGDGTIDVFSMRGMVLVEGLHLAPLAFLFMAAAFRSLDPSLEESARASGASWWTVFRRVTLPLAGPALAATLLITAVRALEAFEVPAILGIPDGIWVFTSRIWRSLRTFPPDVAAAGAYALPLLCLTGLGIALNALVLRRSGKHRTITGRGYRPRAVELGAWRWPAAAAAGLYVLVSAVLPLLMLLYVSTQRVYAPPSVDRVSNASLDAYRRLLDDAHFWTAIRNSVLLGVGAATIVVLGTAVVGWVVVRTRLRGRGVADGLVFLPVAIPGVVLGLALLVLYLRVPIPVYGTLWILLIAFVTRFMPYGIRSSTFALVQVSRELEESARASGAGWWATFRRVLLPLLAPALAAAWIYVLLLSLRELSTALLLYSPGNEVLSVVVWDQYANGEFPELAALGVLFVLASAGLAAVGWRLRGWRR